MKHLKTELKWAVIFTAMLLVWMFLERILGLHSTQIDKHATFSNFIMIPAVAIYVLALLDKRNNFYAGGISYKQAFLSGVIISGIVTLLSPLTQYLIAAVVSPDFFENMIKYQVAEGNMQLAEAESYFKLKNFIVESLIATPLMGLITTAVVALFVRRKVDTSKK